MPLLPLAAALSALALPQGPSQVEVLHTELPGFSSSQVPGRPGFEFYAIDWLRVAPNGRYAFRGYYQSPSLIECAFQDGALVIAENDPAPWQPGATVTLIRGVTTDSAGRTTIALVSGGNRPYLVQYEQGAWNIEGEFGDPIPGIGGTYGTFYDPAVRADGTVGFMNDNAGGLGFGLNDFVFGDDTVLARIGTDAPAGQLDGGSATWSSFDGTDARRGLRLSHNTPDWMASGVLSNGTRTVVLNGTVIAQSGFVLPGSGFTQGVLGYEWNSIDPDGGWWLLGTNANAREYFAMHDGALYAKSGDPVVAGDARVWTSTAGAPFEFAASSGDHTYLGGRTTINGNSQSPIITYNGTHVLLEPGDPIDVDGDGDFDENVSFFNLDVQGAGVDSLGRLVLTVSLRQQGSFQNATSIIRISPPTAPLLQLTNVVAGQTATVAISGGVPGQLARTAFSLAGGGPSPIPTPYGEILLALSPPWVETSQQSLDAQGETSWSQGIPANLVGAPVWAQAATYDANGVQVSNPIATTIQ